ncbi:Tripeptidyl-peptidase [Alternaria alternata]|nr:Tripeptidyl-peptidase [Alternaria alternata]
MIPRREGLKSLLSQLLTDRTAMRKCSLCSGAGAPTSLHPSGTVWRCSTTSLPSMWKGVDTDHALTPATASTPVKVAVYLMLASDTGRVDWGVTRQKKQGLEVMLGP